MQYPLTSLLGIPVFSPRLKQRTAHLPSSKERVSEHIEEQSVYKDFLRDRFQLDRALMLIGGMPISLSFLRKHYFSLCCKVVL
jgi:hypothetical protein